MKHLISLVFFLFLSFSGLMAQNRLNINSLNQQDATASDFIEKPQLKAIEQRFIKEHKAETGMDGFRVQLFFGSRDEAQRLKGEFLKLYPKEKAYISYQAPNFKLRIGNYRTQLNAEKFMYEIKGKFPSAYVVNERVELPKYGDR